MTSDQPGSATKDRYGWIDIAKGACISLVVLGHVADWYARNFHGGDPIFWSQVSAFLRPLRMPLFFAISGMLASSSLSRPLRSIWPKTGGLYVLYCIWTLIRCLRMALPGGTGGVAYPTPDQIALAFLLPVTAWYIWALPVYYLLAWWLQRWLGPRSAYALVPMVVLSALSPLIAEATAGMIRPPFDGVHLDGLAHNLLWFYLGLKGKDLWIAAVQHSTWSRFAIAGALFFAAASLLEIGGHAALAIVTTPLALWMAIELLGLIDRKNPLIGVFERIGRQTLPVYLLHLFALPGMTALLRMIRIDPGFLATPTGMLVMPPLVATLLIGASVLGGKLLRRSAILRFLVEPAPSPFAAAPRASQAS